ncbi:homeodomain-interacting protein kinase 3-like [Paralichthys olivaceus]|uniref:homeodomain-interacting protein kinase 3-like n=1 Tax=Paralichthys olivaceus TaxID=8255 RepID=UPI00375000CE
MSQNRVFEKVLISSPTTSYQVQKYLGRGAYGVVMQCRNVTTNETVALKMIKSMEDNDSGEDEETLLQIMKELHSDRFNIINLKESFTFKGHYCLVFENLDMDLAKFMKMNPGQHLQLNQIRPILQQLATSLDFLKSAGIIHTDLKPDNIMLVDHVRQPLKVKVIDFGLACNDPEEMIGEIIQCLWYRAPEILHKNPFGGAIDIWSLGCLAAELFMGSTLFPAANEADLMSQIGNAVRDPLHEGHSRPHAFWPRNFLERRFVGTHPVWGDEPMAEYCDMEWFMDLLSQMLMINQYERITPSGILQHPFLTMSHLQGSSSHYARSCKDLMDMCQDQSSDDGHGDQVILQMSLKEDSSSSTAGPAEEGSPAGKRDEKHSFSQTTTVTRAKKIKINAGCGNRPDDSHAKIRSERLAATGKGTSGQTGPLKCQRKRKRLDPTSDGNPSTKKRNMSLKKERGNKSEAAPSNSAQVHFLRKRKRDEEEVPVLDKTCPGKRKRVELGCRELKTGVRRLKKT